MAHHQQNLYIYFPNVLYPGAVCRSYLHSGRIRHSYLRRPPQIPPGVSAAGHRGVVENGTSTKKSHILGIILDFLLLYSELWYLLQYQQDIHIFYSKTIQKFQVSA